MTTSADLDPAIKSALNHLHSTQLSSASDIRLILDSIIKKQLGFSSMLVNRLSKKQLAEEESAPGVMVSLPEPLEILDSPPPPEEPIDDPENDVLQIDEQEPEETEDIEMNDEDFNDLNCIICGSIMYSATNRLMECAECHSLVHQQCHSPNIDDDLFQEPWICSNCNEKTKTPIANIDEPAFPATKSSSSSSAPSSASSSPYHKSAEVPPSKTTSSKSSSSSSSLKEDSKAGTKLISSSHSSSRSQKTHSSSSGKKHKSGSSSSKSSSSKDHDRKSKKSK